MTGKRRGPAPRPDCAVCGAPRWERATQALCELHQREKWAANKRSQNARRKAGLAPTPKPKRKRKAAANPAAPAAPLLALPATVEDRITLRTTGDSITLDRTALARLLDGRAQPALELPIRLAVVAPGLDRALLYEARPVGDAPLDEDASAYARQLDALRQAGYLVCVEG